MSYNINYGCESHPCKCGNKIDAKEWKSLHLKHSALRLDFSNSKGYYIINKKCLRKKLDEVIDETKTLYLVLDKE